MNYDPQSKMIVLDAMDLMTGEATGDAVIIDPRLPFATRPTKRGTEITYADINATSVRFAYVTSSGKDILNAKREAMKDIDP